MLNNPTFGKVISLLPLSVVSAAEEWQRDGVDVKERVVRALAAANYTNCASVPSVVWLQAKRRKRLGRKPNQHLSRTKRTRTIFTPDGDFTFW